MSDGLVYQETCACGVWEFALHGIGRVIGTLGAGMDWVPGFKGVWGAPSIVRPFPRVDIGPVDGQQSKKLLIVVEEDVIVVE